jgi:hypothetical protein
MLCTYRIKSDPTDARFTIIFHTSIVVYVIRHQLCTPQNHLMMAYTGNVLRI